MSCQSTFASATNVRVPVIGFASNFENLAPYHSISLYLSRYDLVSMQVDMAWAFTMLAVNTLMTASIMGRIMCAWVHYERDRSPR